MPYRYEITALGREEIDNPPRGGNAPWVRVEPRSTADLPLTTFGNLVRRSAAPSLSPAA